MSANHNNQPGLDENKMPRKSMYARWAGIRFAMVVFDVIAVNFAYFITLFIRYYTNHALMETADVYMQAFLQFAPWYTVCCIVVFGLFKLYSGLWKYAGLNDMNRIIAANAVTAVIHVAGTLLFIRRMTITYYVLGAAIQFMLIAASRFSYRLITAETTKIRRGRNRTAFNVMIVGVGETGRIVRKRIENDHNNAAQPVCLFAPRGAAGSQRVDGLPVLSGMEHLKEYLKKYQIQCVILADSILPDETRKQIREICAEVEVGVQDFSGYFQNEGTGLTFKMLMEYASGAVDVVSDGKAQSFDSGEQALMTLGGQYDVQSVSAHEDKLVVRLSAHQTVLNNVNESWVREFEQETGESVSFF